MKSIDIIMINMSSFSEWERGVSNRNFHILNELLKSESVGKILSVDYPPLTIKRALRNYRENILVHRKSGTIIARGLARKLTQMNDRLYVYSDCMFFLRPAHTMQRIRQAATHLRFGDFIVWSYFPPAAQYLRGMGFRLSVFDTVDNWAEHASYRNIRDRLHDSYQSIKSDADVIFTVSDELQSLFDNQPNVFWIPNGVDLTHYQTTAPLVNRDIADIPKPVIGYIGVLQDRVDVSLLEFLAEKNPTKSFAIVGPVWRDEDRKKLSKHPNIFVLGYKSYRDAPSYIQQFDIGIIPHKQTPFIASTNPMKLYEYLACGKPVVATKGSGAEMFKNLVYIASDFEDFNRKLFLAMQENSKDRELERRQAVREHSWDAAATQMLDIISKKLIG